MERVAEPRGLQAVSALGFQLVWEVAMVLQVEFPFELPAVLSPGGVAEPRGLQAVSALGLHLVWEVAIVLEAELLVDSEVVVV